jgi:hypothetical protein
MKRVLSLMVVLICLGSVIASEAVAALSRGAARSAIVDQASSDCLDWYASACDSYRVDRSSRCVRRSSRTITCVARFRISTGSGTETCSIKYTAKGSPVPYVIAGRKNCV